MKDESLFPPRCCKQAFPYERVKALLSQRLKSAFGTKRVELETKDRTYCAIPTCSTFIKPSTIDGRVASCTKCHVRTCMLCKSIWHLGACPKDEAMEALIDAAGKNLWQSCPGCHRIVELQHGCNHITYVSLTHREDLASN